ncbi:kinase-like domain, phloem protein 2-like protein [Tanacetum coccineum]
MSKCPEIYSTIKKEDLYNIFSTGILLQQDKVLLTFDGDRERNEMVSATMFSYIGSCPHELKSLPESRFGTVVEMVDISDLNIEIKTRAQFLSRDVVYGVYLVFKFCDSRNFSSKPMYVNLNYRKGHESLHAYFATWRDEQWMMIELSRFLNQNQDDVFEFLVESFSSYYCGDAAVYVEGIEFRAIDKVKHEENEKLKEAQQVLESDINVGQAQQLPTKFEEIFKIYRNYDKLFWLGEVEGKKFLVLSAKAALYKFSNVDIFTSKPSAKSRFQEVIELLPQQVSEKCQGLHCPVKVQDVLHKENTEAEFVYFMTPSSLNINGITRVPKQREDGWMEIQVWKFNSTHEFKDGSLSIDMKFTSHEGIMSGLIVCGLEFRPALEVKVDGLPLLLAIVHGCGSCYGLCANKLKICTLAQSFLKRQRTDECWYVSVEEPLPESYRDKASGTYQHWGWFQSSLLNSVATKAKRFILIERVSGIGTVVAAFALICLLIVLINLYAMLTSLVPNGCLVEAIKFLYQMRAAGVQPQELWLNKLSDEDGDWLFDSGGLYANRITWEDGEQQFWMEISLLSSLKHKNLASIFGFCDENNEKIIIKKRQSRGSLGNYIKDPFLLTWVKRLEICVGLSHALSYIHNDEPRDFTVIHRNIDSCTVLLNDNWETKLSYFELFMKIKASQRHHSFHSDKVWSTNGYTDPIYIKTKTVNHKSDMYSLGIVLFEVLCGRNSVISDEQAFLRNCVNEERSRRPDIGEVVKRLEKALELQLAHENRLDMAEPEGKLAGKQRFGSRFRHLKIELEAIKSATNKFDDAHCIGKGGFGKVYKGELVHSKGQSVVALKRLDRAFGQGNPEFWKEIITLSLYKHNNIVSLLGFCDDCGEMILVYEYASKRSLDLYLNDKDLTWVQRLEICIGAARGLAYLHNPGRTQQRVLHRDIKSSNILLDENWNARIADLGLSKFGPANQKYSFLVSNAVGTIGYCDPLYVETGLLTKESDVYSFGVVLFELLCGRLSIGNSQDGQQPLTELVRKCYKQNTMDEIIYGNIKDEINPHSLKAFTTIAYQCLMREQEQRPLMTKVVKVLESALQLQFSNVPPPPSQRQLLQIEDLLVLRR